MWGLHWTGSVHGKPAPNKEEKKFCHHPTDTIYLFSIFQRIKLLHIYNIVVL